MFRPKGIFHALIVLLALTSAVCLQAAETKFQVIATDELKKLLDENAAMTVIDARNPEEYQEVHIKGAINIPEKKFSEYAAQLPADKGARLVFYCNGVKCGKSKKAAQKAAELGYSNILIYSEGMPVWEEKGLSIYAGPDYEKKIETTKIAPADLDALSKSGAAAFIPWSMSATRRSSGKAASPAPSISQYPNLPRNQGAWTRTKKIIVYCNSCGSRTTGATG
ncbi:MAG: rhodanese-like domain-containing protein [Desulfobulbaceae bacterium]